MDTQDVCELEAITRSVFHWFPWKKQHPFCFSITNELQQTGHGKKNMREIARWSLSNGKTPNSGNWKNSINSYSLPEFLLSWNEGNSMEQKNILQVREHIEIAWWLWMRIWSLYQWSWMLQPLESERPNDQLEKMAVKPNHWLCFFF